MFYAKIYSVKLVLIWLNWCKTANSGLSTMNNLQDTFTRWCIICSLEGKVIKSRRFGPLGWLSSPHSRSLQDFSFPAIKHLRSLDLSSSLIRKIGQDTFTNIDLIEVRTGGSTFFFTHRHLRKPMTPMTPVKPIKILIHICRFSACQTTSFTDWTRRPLELWQT